MAVASYQLPVTRGAAIPATGNRPCFAEASRPRAAKALAVA
jgi:hypothetical protein